jgi:hypothetical protein
MIIFSQTSGNKEPVVLSGANNVIVALDSGEPIAVGMKVNDAVWFKTAGEKGFNDILNILGYNKIPEVQSIKL